MSRQPFGPDVCPREQEIVDLLRSDRSTEEHADGLRAHAAECGACAEALELARLLRDDQRTLCDEAAVPAAGAVWWRATMRARAEAARTAGQPITLLQGIAAATAVGLFLGLVSAWWRTILPGGAWFVRVGELVAPTTVGPTMGGLLILLALAAGLVVAPLAVYFATADD
jgi:hypothetical protein